MSVLVEIAGRADVSVESVVRVLTREPVDESVKRRILAVLDQLDAEQTRVLERFALAAVHDAVPLEAEDDPPSASQPALRDGQQSLGESVPRAANGARASGRRPAHSEPELPVGLGTLLEELVSAVWEIRHESRSDRQERLDDLAVLVDLMTTSWQGVDRRLGQLEQLVARREAEWRISSASLAGQFERSLRQPVLEAAPPPLSPATEDRTERKRRWHPFVGTLLLLIGLIGVLIAFDLLPSRAESPGFLPATENGPGTTQATNTGSSATVSGPSRPSAPAQTTAPARSTAPRGRPTPAQQTPRKTSTGAARQAAPPTTTAPPGTGSTIKPARVFVWPPIKGVARYSVQFFRAGKLFYAVRASEPRLTIPNRVVFGPGAYRWIVRPVRGTGPDGLGRPIIDSSFTVAKP